MASQSIFAPNVNSYEPAFNYKDACRIYFALSDFAKDEAPENKKANIGQAIAKVYLIGPQYETEIPVKNKVSMIK